MCLWFSDKTRDLDHRHDFPSPHYCFHCPARVGQQRSVWITCVFCPERAPTTRARLSMNKRTLTLADVIVDEVRFVTPVAGTHLDSRPVPRRDGARPSYPFRPHGPPPFVFAFWWRVKQGLSRSEANHLRLDSLLQRFNLVDEIRPFGLT